MTDWLTEEVIERASANLHISFTQNWNNSRKGMKSVWFFGKYSKTNYNSEYYPYNCVPVCSDALFFD